MQEYLILLRQETVEEALLQGRSLQVEGGEQQEQEEQEQQEQEEQEQQQKQQQEQ
jgi:hypothetical protein